MIKKTAVLEQRRVVRVGENPDLGIGQYQPTNQIILQITLDGPAKWFLGQTAPGFLRNIVAIESATKFLLSHQRFQHAIPGVLGEDARQMIKLLHLLKLAIAA